MPLDIILPAPGTYTLADDGIVGNGISVIRDADRNILFVVVHPADVLNITVAGPGVTLIIGLTDSLGAADLNVGVLDNPALSPDVIRIRGVHTTGDVTLVSNGPIVEAGSDAAADILAGTLILSGQTAVGTGANALETQVGIIEAETLTGGINLANAGTVQVGGLTDLVDGLNVETSGNLSFVNLGSIFLSEVDLDTGSPPTPLESVHGGATSGNVTLIANGFSSDIIANTNLDAITVLGGNLVLHAGRDIAFGAAGANFDNDVRVSGSVDIDAGRDLLVDGFSDLASDDFGLATGGDLVINVGRNVHMRNVTGDDASILANGNAGANVVITTGFDGAFILDTPSSVGFDPLESNSGDVAVNADRILINAVSSIRADDGTVFLRPSTSGREIILGSATDVAFALELSDGELDRIFTANLTIGTATGGTVRTTASVSPANAQNVTLLSGNDVRFEAAFTTLAALTARAGDSVLQFAASAISAGEFNAFVDEAGEDGGAGGLASLQGVVAASPATVNGAAEADTLIGSAADETVLGGGGADTLNGRGGNDTLDGGTGADAMTGGLGNDIFIVDHAGDVVVEAPGEGIDTVQSAISFTLGANVENLTLTGAADINGTGNALANAINGNNGQNLLDGGAGADTMIGFLGNDSYVVDDVGDVVIETSGAGGTDLVQSAVTFTLGSNVENLTLTGGAAIDGTGNNLANILTGNAAANLLDGKVGADTMNGGGGNDTYIVNDAGDVVIDSAGVDTVRSTIDYTLAAALENLVLLGNVAINGTGNGSANTINGNSAANILNGGGASDNLHGGAGHDDLIGGTGSDGFRFDTGLNAATNVDDILDFSVADDTIFLDRDIFTGIAANGTLPVAAFRAGTVAVDADDRILYDAATGQIRYDADGVGGSAAVLFATVTAGTALTNADFVGYV